MNPAQAPIANPRGRLALAVPLALALASPIALAEDEQARQLQRLRQAIDAVTRDIGGTEKRRHRLSRELERFDRQIAAKAKALAQLERDRQANERRLKKLRGQKRDILARTRDQRRQLRRQARAAYLMGRQHPVKLLLQEDDPNRLGRMLVYYDYFNRHRLEQLGALSQQLAELQALEQQLQQETRRQQALRQRYQEQQTALRQQRQRRQVLIQRLEQELARSQRKLAQLQADQQRLAKLTRAIRQAAPPPRRSHTRFARLKGKLIWPVEGRIRHRFGSLRPTGKLRWQGVVIAAQAGTPVRAVADGRVVFADWMRGFGFLIIVDHGGDYFSLYGHNQRLLKGVGERVRQGETLATVGNSGGQKTPALYFEIRYRGKAVNPRQWMLARR